MSAVFVLPLSIEKMGLKSISHPLGHSRHSPCLIVAVREVLLLVHVTLEGELLNLHVTSNDHSLATRLTSLNPRIVSIP